MLDAAFADLVKPIVQRLERIEAILADGRTPANDADPYFGGAEVEAYASVNRRTVARAADRGELRAYRIGNRRRFRKSDVDAWLAGQGRRRRPTVDQVVARALGR
jgi:excisionase family DNA binding protein